MSKKARAIPLGKAIQWTEAEVDELTKVTPQDIEEASALWRRGALPKYRGLFDAKPAEPNG